MNIEMVNKDGDIIKVNPDRVDNMIKAGWEIKEDKPAPKKRKTKEVVNDGKS